MKGFPCGADGKESAYNTGDLSSIPALPTSPGEMALQCLCLENYMDRGTWRTTVNGVAKCQTTEQLTHSLSVMKVKDLG